MGLWQGQRGHGLLGASRCLWSGMALGHEPALSFVLGKKSRLVGLAARFCTCPDVSLTDITNQSLSPAPLSSWPGLGFLPGLRADSRHQSAGTHGWGRCPSALPCEFWVPPACRCGGAEGTRARDSGCYSRSIIHAPSLCLLFSEALAVSVVDMWVTWQMFSVWMVIRAIVELS